MRQSSHGSSKRSAARIAPFGLALPMPGQRVCGAGSAGNQPRTRTGRRGSQTTTGRKIGGICGQSDLLIEVVCGTTRLRRPCIPSSRSKTLGPPLRLRVWRSVGGRLAIDYIRFRCDPRWAQTLGRILGAWLWAPVKPIPYSTRCSASNAGSTGSYPPSGEHILHLVWSPVPKKPSVAGLAAWRFILGQAYHRPACLVPSGSLTPSRRSPSRCRARRR